MGPAAFINGVTLFDRCIRLPSPFEYVFGLLEAPPEEGRPQGGLQIRGSKRDDEARARPVLGPC